MLQAAGSSAAAVRGSVSLTRAIALSGGCLEVPTGLGHPNHLSQRQHQVQDHPAVAVAVQARLKKYVRKKSLSE